MIFQKSDTTASPPWTALRIEHTLIPTFKGIAMTVATGFSVLFLVAIPAAITAISLAMIGCSAARDTYRRHKHLA
jgi:hypothetical protein